MSPLVKPTRTVRQWLSLFLLFHGVVQVASQISSSRLAFASLNAPPPPLSMPVWSLACPIVSSFPELTEQETSMNIVTFAVPVSVEAPKLWVVSLYYNTLTHQSMMDAGKGVLQLLTPYQELLVPILGKQTGFQQGISKRNDCAKLGYDWIRGGGFTDRNAEANKESLFLPQDDNDLAGLDLLPHCASYVLLKLLSTMPAGDHEVALCRVDATGVWDKTTSQVVGAQNSDEQVEFDPKTALYTGQLRWNGLL